jgi:uncharacterized repeat protein (TIGR03803 family)
MKKPLLNLARLMLVIALANRLSNAQTYTDLFNFDTVHGANPEYPGLLVQGRDGNLYGTTARGGNTDSGVVFKITPEGTLTVLYEFCSKPNCDDGSQPHGGLILGADGNFYGSTLYQGSGDAGTVFRMTPNGTLTTGSFYDRGGRGPNAPNASPIQGRDLNFYGTTLVDVAYKITPMGHFTLLGGTPGQSFAPLVQASFDGNFYGTTNGGAPDGGAVFKMTPKGATTIVYRFPDCCAGSDAGLIQGNDGNLYGTDLGGVHDKGEAFEVTPQGTFRSVYSFGSSPNDGTVPYTAVVQANDGNLYGVTANGGTLGYGVIFQLSLSGSYSILYDFDGMNGAYPESTLMQHTNGKFYGLTYQGGFGNEGVVYSFDLQLSPFAGLVPIAGKVGQTGGILGQGFTGTAAVSFNGVPAAYTVLSDTYLKATVPAGATTGYVTVTTPSGTLTSNVPFQVIP